MFKIDQCNVVETEHNSRKNAIPIFFFTGFKPEQSFFEDMDSLHVQRPDVITRVTDYVPEIIEYIQTLIKKNYETLLTDRTWVIRLSNFINHGSIAEFSF